MNDYEHKLVIELYEETLKERYDLDDTYRIIRELFARKNIHDISSSRNKLVFVTYFGERDTYGKVGAITNTIYDSWLRPYLKTMDWCIRSKTGEEENENCLEAYKAIDERNGIK